MGVAGIEAKPSPTKGLGLLLRDTGTDFCQTRLIVDIKAFKKALIGNLYFMNLENRGQTAVWPVPASLLLLAPSPLSPSRFSDL